MDPSKMTKEEMITYLTFLRDVCGKNLKASKIYHYAGMGDYLLQHGVWFDPPATIAKWTGTPKACFANSRFAAKRFRWRYVEGEANYIIPVHHAWCVDENDQVQEVTWREPGNLYFGVVFTPTPKDCVFNNYENLKIYKKKREDNGNLL
jgi:hypothetical protein